MKESRSKLGGSIVTMVQPAESLLRKDAYSGDVNRHSGVDVNTYSAVM
jgi:hypothetical protein